MLRSTRPHGGPGPAATLADRLREAVESAPSAEAIIDGSTRVTYGDLWVRAGELAAGLRADGLTQGDVVLVQLPNWWESVVAVWGTWLAGGVVLPVVPIYRAQELGFIIDQADPAVVIAPESYRGYDHARELRDLAAARSSPTRVVGVRMERDVPGVRPFETMRSTGDLAPATTSPDDVALVLYTSGTTADPKGVLHTHRTLLSEAASIRQLCRLTSRDRVFMPSPLGHITGTSYAVVLPADLACAAVLLDRWDPDAAVALVEEERCTFTVSATPFLRGLTDAYARRRDSRSALRTFVCGGADIPPELVRRAHAVTGTAVVRTYGSTEMPTLAMADPFGDLDAAADSEGHAIGENEMALRPTDGGVTELVARGPELFVGYVDATLNSASFTDDGFFRTGDTATIDSDGALRISGRIKDIINRGGEKYSAAEVEWVLLDHPRVAEVAIVGYPDEVLGERACAYIVPTQAGPPTLADLRAHLVAAGFAVQKSPERLEIVADLPRTASGKIQKFRLRERPGQTALSTEAEPDT